jgi:dihydroorotate dehydrogenase electron transfer subunit
LRRVDEEAISEFTISKIVEENPKVRTFVLSGPLVSEDSPANGSWAGKFVMLGLPDGGERPFSPSGIDQVTIRQMPRCEKKKDVPTFTERVFGLKEGDPVYVREVPCNGFSINYMNYTIVGGGIGLAPLRAAAQVLHGYSKEIGKTLRTRIFAGGRTKADVLFEKDFRTYGELHIATEDGSGSPDYRGTVIDMMRSMPREKWKADGYMVCGPEKMMPAALDLINDYDSTQCSVERIIKCGIGICDSCDLDGLSVCNDGPVFRGSELKRNADFGKYTRTKSGRRVPL